jgi:Sulfotransferase domain
MNRNHVIVAGMPRSATTYLYHMLQRHPQIFTPYIKEINYFVAKYDRGIDWYAELFKEAEPYQITFDVSPATFLDPEADQRIMQHFPQAKILVMVRDPLEWCLSFHSQFKSFDSSTPSFEEFVRGHTYTHGSGMITVRFENDFVPTRIRQMMSRFGDRLLLMSYRITKNSPLQALQIIEQFCGLPPYFSAENVLDMKINASGRRNVRIVSYLLSRDWLVHTVGRLGLGPLAQAARQVFDRYNASRVRTAEELYAPDEIALNNAKFAQQQAWVDNLFRETLVLVGGKPFLPVTMAGEQRPSP